MKCSLLLLGLLAPFAVTAADRKTETLKKFSPSDQTISKDLKVADDKAWLADCSQPQVSRLFEIADPGVDSCMVIYRARLKSEGLDGQAYLEMWCRFPGKRRVLFARPDQPDLRLE